jgi:hypothetical protein
MTAGGQGSGVPGVPLVIGAAGEEPEEPDAVQAFVSELRGRLAAAGTTERERILLDLVRMRAAEVLGHDTADQVEVWRGFIETGFESVTGVELSHKLSLALGLTLPVTLIFDYPTPAALAEHLREEYFPGAPPGADPPASPVDEAVDEQDGAAIIDTLDLESLVRLARDGTGS